MKVAAGVTKQVISVRLNKTTATLLQRCKEDGTFESTTDVVLAGLRLLARQLRHDAIHREIAIARDSEDDAAYAMVELEEWAVRWDQADQGHI